MKNNNVFHVSIGVALVVLLALLSDLTPWMPPMAAMMALLGAAVLLAVFAGFVMREKGGDEREIVHRMNAGRVAYLSGIATLTVALIVQGFAHAIDPWILAALGVMVVTKIGSRLYSDRFE